MPDKPDLNEKFSLHPLTGEEALRKLLGVDEDDPDPTPDAPEDDDI